MYDAREDAMDIKGREYNAEYLSLFRKQGLPEALSGPFSTPVRFGLPILSYSESISREATTGTLS